MILVAHDDKTAKGTYCMVQRFLFTVISPAAAQSRALSSRRKKIADRTIFE